MCAAKLCVKKSVVPAADSDDDADSEEAEPVAGHDDDPNTEAEPVVGHDDNPNTEGRVFADPNQDGEVSVDAINEWVQEQWMSLTEPTQEGSPKVDNKKDARQKAVVIKMPLPLGPHQTMTHTEQSQSTPASTVAWTSEDRVRLREKIQAHLREKIQDDLIETPTEARDSCPSSRSSSPRVSRSSSPRTSEQARLLHGSNSPQERTNSIVPQPPPGSPACDGVCMPPSPPESPPSNQLQSIAIQTQQPCSTTLVRRGCASSAVHLKIGPDSTEEIDVEAMNLDGHDQHTQQSEGLEQSVAAAKKDGQAKVPRSSGIESPLPWWWHLVTD